MAKTEKGGEEDGQMISECWESSRVCAACSGVGHCVLCLKTIDVWVWIKTNTHIYIGLVQVQR